MSLNSNIISTHDARKTSINLYDQENKLELFQLKAYTDKAEINSSQDINISSKQINIINSDGKIVTDLTNTILNIISDLNSEISDRNQKVIEIDQTISEQKDRIDTILQGADVNLDQIKEVVDFFKDLDTTRLTQINTLQNDVITLANAVSVLQQKFNSTFNSTFNSN